MWSPPTLSRQSLIKTAVGLLLAVSFGCTTPLQISRPTNLYTLEYTAPDFPDFSTVAATLRISPFGAAPEYQTANIAYREKEFTRGYYPYNKWLAPPPQLVHYFLERDLAKANPFSTVLSSPSRLQPDYTLEGTVEDFLEIDGENGWIAQLSLNILLQRMSKSKKAGTTLMQRSYRFSAPCSNRTPQAVAAAMSEAMREVSYRIQRDIYLSVSADMQAAGQHE